PTVVVGGLKVTVRGAALTGGWRRPPGKAPRVLLAVSGLTGACLADVLGAGGGGNVFCRSWVRARQPAGQQLIQDAANRPDVVAERGRLAQPLLGSHVRERADQGPRGAELGSGDS